jgi:hypothetical protein
VNWRFVYETKSGGKVHHHKTDRHIMILYPGGLVRLYKNISNHAELFPCFASSVMERTKIGMDHNSVYVRTW